MYGRSEMEDFIPKVTMNFTSYTRQIKERAEKFHSTQSLGVSDKQSDESYSNETKQKPENINMAHQLIRQESFTANPNIFKNYVTTMVQGTDFIAKDHGFSPNAPTNKNYVFFSIKRTPNSIKKSSLFECHIIREDQIC